MRASFCLPRLYRVQLGVLLLLALLAMTGLAHADRHGAATDVNLITAIDVSESLTRPEEGLQVQGLADALLEPDFLHLVAAGYHRRVGVHDRHG